MNVGGPAGRVPVRVGRHVELVRTSPDQYAALHRALDDERVSGAWRTRGRAVPVDRFEDTLLAGVDFSTTIVARESGRLVGLVQLQDTCWEDRRGELAVASFVPGQPNLILEAVLLFCDEVFHRFGLRKVYAGLLCDGVEDWQDLVRPAFDRQGVLTAHRWHDGAWRDVDLRATAPERLASHLEAWPMAAALSQTGWRCLN